VTPGAAQGSVLQSHHHIAPQKCAPGAAMGVVQLQNLLNRIPSLGGCGKASGVVYCVVDWANCNADVVVVVQPRSGGGVAARVVPGDDRMLSSSLDSMDLASSAVIKPDFTSSMIDFLR
jgi:hypothetical protein